MDMKCLRCLESWDISYIREDILPDVGPCNLWKAAAKAPKPTHSRGFTFSAPGPYIESCPACPPVVDDSVKDESAIIRAIADLMGDDIDGFCSEIEDMEALGMFSEE